MSELNRQRLIERNLAAALAAIVVDCGVTLAHTVRPAPEGLTKLQCIGLDALRALEAAYGTLQVRKNYGEWIAHFNDYDEGVKYAHGDSAEHAFAELLEVYL